MKWLVLIFIFIYLIFIENIEFRSSSLFSLLFLVLIVLVHFIVHLDFLVFVLLFIFSFWINSFILDFLLLSKTLSLLKSDSLEMLVLFGITKVHKKDRYKKQIRILFVLILFPLSKIQKLS